MTTKSPKRPQIFCECRRGDISLSRELPLWTKRGQNVDGMWTKGQRRKTKCGQNVECKTPWASRNCRSQLRGQKPNYKCCDSATNKLLALMACIIDHAAASPRPAASPGCMAVLHRVQLVPEPMPESPLSRCVLFASLLEVQQHADLLNMADPLPLFAPPPILRQL
jgi:hypothetical protein